MTYEDVVTLIVAVVVFFLCSIVSMALFIKESDRCCRLRRENQKLRRLMEQRIQMAATASMPTAPCCGRPAGPTRENKEIKVLL